MRCSKLHGMNTFVIYSKVRQLRFAKEESEGRKITYDVMRAETGLARATLAKLLKREPIDRIDGNTLASLCRYFGVGVGDLLEYVPEEATAH